MVNRKCVDDWLVPIFVFIFVIIIVPIVTKCMEVSMTHENSPSDFWDILKHKDTPS